MNKLFIIKKLIVVIMLMAGLTAVAQNGHLVFKGIPIDGSLKTFVDKLEQKGFSKLMSEGGIAMLEGPFAGYKGCIVGVFELESGVVNRVSARFPSRDTWSLLYSDYSNLKGLLTEKYGEPAEVKEVFQNEKPSYQFDDNDKMFEVRMDRCRYICDWVTENGTIELRIDHTVSAGCYVCLVYADLENESKARSSAIDDL